MEAILIWLESSALSLWVRGESGWWSLLAAVWGLCALGVVSKLKQENRHTDAGLILYLASDESAFCTGADFPIDGGHSCGTLLPMLPRKSSS